MKAASGETVRGGDMRPWPMVEGLSLEMLWVLDRILWGGEATPEEGRDMPVSIEENIVAVFWSGMRAMHVSLWLS